jgi:hypothetical protein
LASQEHELEVREAKEALASSEAELNDCRLLNEQLKLQLEEVGLLAIFVPNQFSCSTHNHCFPLQAQKQASEDRRKLDAIHAAEVQQCRETIENQKVQLIEQEQLKRQSNDMSHKFFQLQSEMVGLQGVPCSE